MIRREPGLYPSTPAKLIFNPTSGAPGDSPTQLLQILTGMQALNFQTEAYVITPESDLKPVIQDALARGIRTFVASGGDGTIDSTAALLAGSRATLGIIPTGTQNNVALSLNIPTDISRAVALLRTGHHEKVDLGITDFAGARHPFLEVCSVGLLSALFPAADDIQHGNLARIGDLLATLVASPPAEIHLQLDQHGEIHTQGHVVLIANMPFIGPHYPITAPGTYADGLLDVLVFSNLTKLDLLGSVVQVAGGGTEDPRVGRYRVRQVTIHTRPPMPVLADGFPLGEGSIQVSVHRRALRIISGLSSEGDR